MHVFIAIVGVILSLIVGFVVGVRHGYRAGYDACDFEHDFDRCPHCKEFLVQGEDDDEDTAGEHDGPDAA